MAPPPELLECLTQAGAVHVASNGSFDPTVQPLCALWAEAAAEGSQPAANALARTRARGRWKDLGLSSEAITLAPGMALTLNGIAQGYIADRVADLLAAEGRTDILVDAGEHRALGGRPDGTDWTLVLAQGGNYGLRDRALATSALLGTDFDAAGRIGHILDPRMGEPAVARWSAISMTAPSAALVDALSTAACLLPDGTAVNAMTARFDGVASVSAWTV